MIRQFDLTDWEPFRIEELFDVVKGSRLRSVDREEGDIPYVGASLFNNGYTHMISNDEHVHPGNVLTTAYNGTIPGKTFYQPNPFWATDDVNVLYPKFGMTVESGLFIAPLIEVVGKNYVYVDKWKLQDMIDAVIFLPVNPDGEPDWGYMEQKMREVMTQQGRELDVLVAEFESPRTAIDTSAWRDFLIEDLFEVVKGTRLTKGNMIPGATRHIGASQFDNGVTSMIANTEAVHPGNVLTVCYDGPVGTTFYQPEAFWATDAVNILYPRFELNEAIALFLIPVLQEAGSGFNYGQKWGAEAMRATLIRLPVDSAGQPDWALMETTVTRVLADREAVIDSLQALVAGV